MNIRIQMTVGSEATDLLRNESFINVWRKIARIDPKFTSIQEPEFVIPWYESYYVRYMPVLVYGENEKGEIIGVMPLAQERKGGKFTHAGDQQAEYHGWVAQNVYEPVFLVQCLILIKDRFRLTKWNWSWLADGIKIDYFLASILRKHGIYVVVESQAVPLWDLKDAHKMKSVLRSRSVRAKINRFKRRGILEFVRIKDHDQFEKLLPIIAIQSDFRKEVTFDSRPFGDDPCKTPFLREYFKISANLHVTALFLDRKPIAIHVGVAGKDRVLLGIICYDPVEGSGSPGSLLIAFLGQKLKEEGYYYFDLTPGSDPYKHRYANCYKNYYRPVFYFNRIAWIKGKIKLAFKSTIKGLLLQYFDPTRLRVKLADGKENLRLLKKVGFWKSVLRKIIFEDGRYDLLISAGKPDIDQCPGEFKKQEITHLMASGGSAGIQSRRKLLKKALKRWNEGDILWSFVNHGEVEFTLWMKTSLGDFTIRDHNISGFLPPRSILIYDVSLNENLNSGKVWSLAWQFTDEAIDQIFILTPKLSGFKILEAENFGFVRLLSFQQTHLLGFNLKKRNLDLRSLIKKH